MDEQIQIVPNQTNTPSGERKTPMQMIKSLLPASVSSSNNISSKFPAKKLEIFGAGFFILIIILLVLGIIFRDKLTRRISPTPESSPTPAPIVATPAPTKYATDSAVIKVSSDIQSFDSELSRVDIAESNLKPRPYNWNINFK